jgi:hypothetical protein
MGVLIGGTAVGFLSDGHFLSLLTRGKRFVMAALAETSLGCARGSPH